MVKIMFEVKVGKLMVKEVVTARNGKGESYEFVNIDTYSNSDLSKMGRELMESVDLFIAFMDAIDLTIDSIVEGGKDYSPLTEESLEKVFQIVDDFTAKDSSYYFVDDIAQYKKMPVYSDIDLGKECWSYISDYDAYQNICSEIKDFNQDFFIDLANALKYSKNVILNLERFGNGDTNWISDSARKDIHNAVFVAIEKHFKNYAYDNNHNIWFNKESISNKELGELAWNYIYSDADEYKSISEGDISKIKENMEMIWQNINDNTKELVKNCLLNPKFKVEDDSFEMWDEIQSAVDKTLWNNLNYYYAPNGKWQKLLDFGKTMWNIVIKYDSLFANISKQIEESDSFDYYMECLARNIVKNNNADISDIHEKLELCLDENSVQDYAEWTMNDWLDTVEGYKIINKNMYDVMLDATGTMIENELSDICIWDEDEMLWCINASKPKSVSENIDIKFNSNLKILNTWKEGECKFYSVTCAVPYLSVDGEYKFIYELKFKYDKNNDKYIMLNDNIRRFVGINSEDLYEKVDTICRNHNETSDSVVAKVN